MNYLKKNVIILLITFFSWCGAPINAMDIIINGEPKNGTPLPKSDIEAQQIQSMRAALPLLKSSKHPFENVSWSKAGFALFGGAVLIVGGSYATVYGLTQDALTTLIGGPLLSFSITTIGCCSYNIKEYLLYKKIAKFVDEEGPQEAESDL